MQPEDFLVIGGISLLAGLICHFFYSKNKKLLEEMWAVDTYGAKELRSMVKGGFEATVEVFGTVHCESPIVSLASKVPCCYFLTSVSRQDRRTQTVTSGSGNSRQTRTQTDYVWVEEMTKKKSTLFKIRDKSGYTLVDPTGASIDTDTVADEIVSYREPWFDSFVGISDTGKYRIKESVFRPEGFAYVLGQAFPTEDGDALIKYPKKGYMDPKKKFFFISRKSEKEITQKKQRISKVLGAVRAIFFIAVLYCLLTYFGIAPGF